jgi:hypothetical protein
MDRLDRSAVIRINESLSGGITQPYFADTGITVIQPSRVNGLAYFIQNAPFHPGVLKLSRDFSYQVTNRAQEESFHLHPLQTEIYRFMEGSWTLETSPRLAAVGGELHAEYVVQIAGTGQAIDIIVDPDTCHRLNGTGRLVVIKVPAGLGVGIEKAKIDCNQCPHAPECLLYQGLQKKNVQAA